LPGLTEGLWAGLVDGCPTDPDGLVDGDWDGVTGREKWDNP